MNNFIILDIKSIKNNSSKIIIQNNIPITVYKINNKIFALDNRCPHRGASLGDGIIENNIIECPLHQWKFNIKTGKCLLNSKVKVKSYKVEEIGKKIKIVL